MFWYSLNIKFTNTMLPYFSTAFMLKRLQIGLLVSQINYFLSQNWRNFSIVVVRCLLVVLRLFSLVRIYFKPHADQFIYSTYIYFLVFEKSSIPNSRFSFIFFSVFRYLFQFPFQLSDSFSNFRFILHFLFYNSDLYNKI